MPAAIEHQVVFIGSSLEGEFGQRTSVIKEFYPTREFFQLLRGRESFDDCGNSNNQENRWIEEYSVEPQQAAHEPGDGDQDHHEAAGYFAINEEHRQPAAFFFAFSFGPRPSFFHGGRSAIQWPVAYG